jgi:hypothetical protein
MSKPVQSQAKHKFSAITELQNAHQEIFPLKFHLYIYIYDDWLMELDWMLDINILFFKKLNNSTLECLT